MSNPSDVPPPQQPGVPRRATILRPPDPPRRGPNPRCPEGAEAPPRGYQPPQPGYGQPSQGYQPPPQAAKSSAVRLRPGGAPRLPRLRSRATQGQTAGPLRRAGCVSRCRAKFAQGDFNDVLPRGGSSKCRVGRDAYRAQVFLLDLAHRRPGGVGGGVIGLFVPSSSLLLAKGLRCCCWCWWDTGRSPGRLAGKMKEGRGVGRLCPRRARLAAFTCIYEQSSMPVPPDGRVASLTSASRRQLLDVAAHLWGHGLQPRGRAQ